MARVVTIDAQRFTPDAFASFGWVPVLDTDRRDAIHALAFQWGDAHLNFIQHSPEDVKHSVDGPIVETMFRHDSHTQALMPMNCDAVVAVAPALTDFSNPNHVETLRAFVVRPGDVFVLHKGTWHWGPYPIGRQSVRLLNLQGRRYKEDNTSVRLDEKLGVRVAVRLPRQAPVATPERAWAPEDPPPTATPPREAPPIEPRPVEARPPGEGRQRGRPLEGRRVRRPDA